MTTTNIRTETPEIHCSFTKDGERTIIYQHDSTGMYFKIVGYPKGQDTLKVDGAESMNWMMNLLIDAGYYSPEVSI